MALGQILSLPSNSNGFTSSASTLVPAWTFPVYTTITNGLSYPIYIIGVSYMLDNGAGDDSTLEMLMDIGFGLSGSEVSKIQIPYSLRRDQNSGFYMEIQHTIFLPEPVLAPANTRISYTVARGQAVSSVFEGIKLFYQEGGISPSASTNFLAFFNN